MLIHRLWFGARTAPSQMSIYLLTLIQSRETFSIYDDLMCNHEIDCEIYVIIGVIQQCHMQAGISKWLDAGV